MVQSIGDPSGVRRELQWASLLSIGDPSGVQRELQWASLLSIGDPSGVRGELQWASLLSIGDPSGVRRAAHANPRLFNKVNGAETRAARRYDRTGGTTAPSTAAPTTVLASSLTRVNFYSDRSAAATSTRVARRAGR